MNIVDVSVLAECARLFVTELLRVADGLAVLLAAIAAGIAARANRITAKALRSQYVPWIDVPRALISNDQIQDDRFIFDIEVLMKNHGNAPALNLFADFVVPGGSLPPAKCDTKRVSLMPQAEGTMGRRIQLPLSAGQDLHSQLMTGQKHVQVVMRYEDVFGNSYDTVDEIRFSSKDTFAPIDYRVKGLPR